MCVEFVIQFIGFMNIVKMDYNQPDYIYLMGLVLFEADVQDSVSSVYKSFTSDDHVKCFKSPYSPSKLSYMHFFSNKD